MKYFTPELCVRGNSNDPDEVDRAEVEWEDALKRYEKHYKKIEKRLPPELRKFDSEQCLHDAYFDGPVIERPFALPWSPKYVMIAARQINTLVPEFVNTVAVLFYTITEDPVIETPVDSAVFNKAKPIWLYEEVDAIEPGLFLHEILVSDGRVIKIRFTDFHYSIVPLKQEASAAQKPQKPARRAASA
jgi:hypothetical protein